MPTHGFFEIAGEIVFREEADIEAWLGRPLEPARTPELASIYRHVGEISGPVSAAFGGKVHIFRHGSTVRIAAADLYEELTDPEGRTTQAAACASLLAAAHGARGVVKFTGHDLADSFVVELAGGGYALTEPGEHPDRERAYTRAMADLRRVYEDEAG